ncbi:MAG: bifunctional 5,10-methylenetetrahydrofolate dehydrogenase/5,10-methenyltetrahydrofolate cyclohydrolase [Patescibacteria group bacterium]|jgi:methylenetetrahydrofolate dehydrogenase (NADP+)/methenyltetrahydrofolate cyclohydrolase
MKSIDGRALAQHLRNDIKNEITQSGIKPGLAIVLVGDDPASQLYVSLKERACQEVGIVFEKHLLPTDALAEQVIGLIEELNERADIHGIVVQLPLPHHLNEDNIISAINPLKDADGFHPDNLASLAAEKPKLMPALTLSILDLIHSTGVNVQDRLVVVLANSRVFYKPQAQVLQQAGARTEFVGTDVTSPFVLEADIVIIALGKPGVLKAEHVKDGVVIIDVGITKTAQGVVGDADPESLAAKSGWLTPVPGGVGPMTVAHLLGNTVQAARMLQAHQPPPTSK